MKKFTLLLAAAMFSVALFAETKTDVLNQTDVFKVSGTTYKDVSATVPSGTKYVGNIAGDKGAIQLRSKKSNSGIVSTISIGKIKSIAIKWNSSTVGTRTLDIYGKNKAYAAATDLYDSSLQGTKIGSAVMSDGDQTITIEGNYAFIGLRSKDGAMYIDQITIVWEVGTVEEIPATAIELSETSLEIEQYKQATLTATLEPANATTEIVWTSSDEKIVIVDNGQLNAVGVGTATITASAGEGISATCEVTVKSAPALTCEQAAEIALAVSGNNVVAEGGPYVIRGYVTALAPTKTNNDIAKDLTQYGNYSFWMADSKGEEKVFEAYQVAPVDGQYLAAVGDYVEIVGNLTKYNTTPETTGRGTSTVKKLADPTTGVDNATVAEKAVKMIEDGQLVIIREGVKYNAQGVVIR